MVQNVEWMLNSVLHLHVSQNIAVLFKSIANNPEQFWNYVLVYNHLSAQYLVALKLL